MDDDCNQRRDVNLVLHAVLALALVAVTATSLAYVVPELFDMHSSAADLGALAVAVGTVAFAYLAGRHIWRSFRITMRKDEE